MAEIQLPAIVRNERMRSKTVAGLHNKPHQRAPRHAQNRTNRKKSKPKNEDKMNDQILVEKYITEEACVHQCQLCKDVYKQDTSAVGYLPNKHGGGAWLCLDCLMKVGTIAVALTKCRGAE